MKNLNFYKLLITLIFITPALSSQDREATLISGGFKFTEGPCADKEGNVYFSDIPENKIYKWNGNEVKLFTDKIDGCNGLMFIDDEHIVICESGRGRKVSQINLNTKKIKVLAGSYEGNLFNGPNDLWIDKKGGIYFTDPLYGNRNNIELDTEQVYYISPSGNAIKRVTHDLNKPNGIIASLDGNVLYIADAGNSQVLKYTIEKPGELKNKSVLIEDLRVDGMSIDNNGNLYMSSENVVVYSPEGEYLYDINVPERPTNVCFAGKDMKTLFITARTGIYSIKLNVKGKPY